MAVRFDGASDGLTRARLTGAKTAMGWFRIAADRNDYSVFFDLGQDAIVSTLADGTSLSQYLQGNTTGSSALTVGTWYHIATTLSGDASPVTMTTYLNGTQIATDAQAVPLAGTTMYVGTDRYGEWLNGNAAHVKMWSAVLTAAEIQQEMYVARPVRTADLHLWTPLFSDTDLVDYSGNGRDWTESGTVTTEDGPPVSWGGAVQLVQYAASGPAAQNIGVGAVEATIAGYDITTTPGGIAVAVGAVAQPVAGYAVAAQPGGVTVAPGQAIATIEGYAPTTVQSQSIGVGTAEATIAGYEATPAPGGINAAVGQALATTQGYASSAAPGGINATVGQAVATIEGYAVTGDVSETAQTVGAGTADATVDAYVVIPAPGTVTVAVGGAVATIEGYAPDTARDLTIAVGAAESTTEGYPAVGAFGVITVSVGLAEATAEGYTPDAAPGAIVVTAGQALARAEAYAILPGEPGIAGFVVIGDFAPDSAQTTDSAYGATVIRDVARDSVTVRDA